MIQLLFEASDPSEALATGPHLAAYAQHEGAEVSPWDDGPLAHRDGTHPLVYVAQGSHASYFSSERWFGASAQSGFGCDDTRAPTTAVRPEVDVLDDSDADWLAYPGRWGEKQPSFNNGPTGPATKTQWDAPVRWVEDEGRDGAVALPASGTLVTDFFCSASRAGSVAFMRFSTSRGEWCSRCSSGSRRWWCSCAPPAGVRRSRRRWWRRERWARPGRVPSPSSAVGGGSSPRSGR